MVFIDDGNLSQMILCAENEEIAEFLARRWSMVYSTSWHPIMSMEWRIRKGAGPFCTFCKISWLKNRIHTAQRKAGRHAIRLSLVDFKNPVLVGCK